MKEAIDEIVGEFYTPPGDTGLVVGVTERGRPLVYGYGEKQGAGSGPPGGNTLFEIGSVTKVFTTSLLSLLVSKRELSLDDPVRDIYSILPDMPREITLLRLATHTSGLPKMPPEASWAALMNRGNPYAEYPTTRLMDYLSKYRRKPGPEEEISYSNMGMALLGHILAEKTDCSYEEAVVSLICDGLGMPDTRITLTSGQEERAATPHSGGGKPSSRWDLPAFAGAGALRSTANDMLRFLDAHRGRPASPLTNALRLSHERWASNFPTPSSLMRLFPGASRRRKAASSFTRSIGLGWIICMAARAAIGKLPA